MTDPIFHRDAYARTFDARVTAADDASVVLDRTAFFPGGGGQPCDAGTLASADGSAMRVIDVRRRDGEIRHELDGPPPAVGVEVRGELDWGNRYNLMRTHTALHILCGVVWRDFGAHASGIGRQDAPLILVICQRIT